MNLVKYALWYAKLNLLWLFKYNCRIPLRVWFSYEQIKGGTAIYVYHNRLHIVRECDATKHNNPFGIALDNTDKHDVVRILTRRNWWIIDAIEDMYL